MMRRRQSPEVDIFCVIDFFFLLLLRVWLGRLTALHLRGRRLARAGSLSLSGYFMNRFGLGVNKVLFPVFFQKNLGVGATHKMNSIELRHGGKICWVRHLT